MEKRCEIKLRKFYKPESSSDFAYCRKTNLIPQGMAKMENPIFELSAQEYNLKLAEALKKIPEFKMPEWVLYVKSSPSKERPIDDADFWHKRAASILRQIYLNKVVGVNRLRTRYGSKKNRGHAPAKFKKSGGKIIRIILQQSDRAGFTEIAQSIRGVRRKKPGRQITEKGKEFLESIR